MTQSYECFFCFVAFLVLNSATVSAAALGRSGYLIQSESETQRMCCERKSLKIQNCATVPSNSYAPTCKGKQIRYFSIVSKPL